MVQLIQFNPFCLISSLFIWLQHDEFHRLTMKATCRQCGQNRVLAWLPTDRHPIWHGLALYSLYSLKKTSCWWSREKRMAKLLWRDKAVCIASTLRGNWWTYPCRRQNVLRAKVPRDLAHPVILPKQGHVTVLVTRHYHEPLFMEVTTHHWMKAEHPGTG